MIARAQIINFCLFNFREKIKIKFFKMQKIIYYCIKIHPIVLALCSMLFTNLYTMLNLSIVVKFLSLRMHSSFIFIINGKFHCLNYSKVL